MSPSLLLLLLMCFFTIVSKPSKAKQFIDDSVIGKQEDTSRGSFNNGVNCNGFLSCNNHDGESKSSSSRSSSSSSRSSSGRRSSLKGSNTHSPAKSPTGTAAVLTRVWVPAAHEEIPVFYDPQEELFNNLQDAVTSLQTLNGVSLAGTEERDRRKYKEDGVDRESDKEKSETNIKISDKEGIVSGRITFVKLLGIYDHRADGESESAAFVEKSSDSSTDMHGDKRKTVIITGSDVNSAGAVATQSSSSRRADKDDSNHPQTANNAAIDSINVNNHNSNNFSLNNNNNNNNNNINDSRNNDNNSSISSTTNNDGQSNPNDSSSGEGAVHSSSRHRRDIPGLPMSEENIPKPLSMPGLILAHGYPAEVHHVTTEDGYILELHRIPGPRMVDTSPKKKKKRRRSGRSTGTTTSSSSTMDTSRVLEDDNFRVLLESLDNNQVLSVENMEGVGEILNSFIEEQNKNKKYLQGDRKEEHDDTGFRSEIKPLQRKIRLKRSAARRHMARNRHLIRTVDPMLLMQRGRFSSQPRRGNRRYLRRPTRHFPVMTPPPPPHPQQFLGRPQPSVEVNAKRSISRATLGIDSNESPGHHLNNFVSSDSSQVDEKDQEVKKLIKETSCLDSPTPCKTIKPNTSNKVFSADFKEGNDFKNSKPGNTTKSSSFKQGSSTKKKVVFIQHCLQCSSADFVLNDHNQALGFILADAGYDVWLGNFRGNQYSRRHVTLSPSNVNYWKFKVDDLARYDIPAMVFYVLKVTKSEDLYYVGHSLGTMTFFMATSTNPLLLSKIRLMIALAPSGYLDHMRGGLKLLLKSTQSYYRLVEALGVGEIGGVLPWRGLMMRRFCKPESPLVGVCSSLLPALSGRNNGLHDKDYLPLLLANFPAGTSFRLMAQIGQIIGSDGIRMFDFGNAEENNEHYGSNTPPHYPLYKITCPVAIMWAENDYIVTPEDVARTARHLPNVVLNYRIPHDTFNHVDFLFADIARGLVYEPMLRLLARY